MTDQLTEAQKQVVKQELARRRALGAQSLLTLLGALMLAFGLGFWIHPGAGLAFFGLALMIEMKVGD